MLSSEASGPTRVGPYELIREVAQAPGVLFAEAKDPDGQRRLLQLTRCRHADGEEKSERQRHERWVAQRTRELLEERELVVHAHGGADAENGERVLFWVLPWSETPFLSERAQARKLEASELVELALALARRLARRHAAGKLDPILAEQLLRGEDPRAVEVVGAPVAVSAEWLSTTMMPARLAPEERASREWTKGGDLYRLGRLLLQLEQHAEPVPPEVAQCFLRLANDSPAERPATAEQAVSDILRAAGRVPQADAGAVFAGLLAERPPRGAALPDPQAAASWELPPFPSGELAPDPLASSGRTQALLSSGAVDPEAVTKQAEPATPIPAEAPVLVAPLVGLHARPTPAPEVPLSLSAPITLRLEPLAPAAPEPALAPPSSGAALETVSAPDTLVERPRNVHSSPVAFTAAMPSGFTEETIPGGLPAPSVQAPTVQPFAATAEETPRSSVAWAGTAEVSRNGEGSRSNGHGAKANGQPPIDPLAAAWSAAVLPSGESPWSEVVHPRGTFNRERGDFPGFSEDLPVPARALAEPAPPPPPPPAPAVPAYNDVPTSEIEVELAEALRGIDKRKVVSSVLVALVIIGLIVLLARSGGGPRPPEPLLVAGPQNDVTIDSEPSNAAVIAEADGRTLGRTPLRFLVPQGAHASVFVAAEGYEPVRLTLPERGGLTAKLARIEAAPCGVELLQVEPVDLEGVLADIGPGPARTIPGAAVVRARADQRRQGARLVLCPALGGQERQPLRLDPPPPDPRISVVGPAGASAFLGGTPIGVLPARARVRGAFAQLKVDDGQGASEERWIPAPSELEVTMPTPRARPIARVVTGEEADSTPEPPEVEPAKPAKLERAERVARALKLAKLGQKQLFSNRMQRAKETLEECVNLDPGAAECQKLLGLYHRKNRSTHKAREYFLRYLELAPDAPDAEQVRRMLEP